MIPYVCYRVDPRHRVGGVVLPHQHLDGGWFLDIISVGIKGTVGGSEDVAACYDGASAPGGAGRVSTRRQTNLK